MDAFWIILTGFFVAASGGLLGCFLILRRMAMLSDAISHAVLPGIVIAFFISGSTASIPMLLGASAIGLLATVLIEFLFKKIKIQADASIGIVYTFMFAVGVIMISLLGKNLHIDQECVLYGEIAYVPFDLLLFNGISYGPRSIWILGGLFVVIIVTITVGFKGLYLTTFDPAYAATIGISTAFWHYLLMSAVSITTVVSFESVGAILVVALLIVPAATAYLLTDNFKLMLLLAVLTGGISSVGGYYLASWINGSIAGAMAVVGGLLFSVAFLRYWIIRKKGAHMHPSVFVPSESTELENSLDEKTI